MAEFRRATPAELRSALQRLKRHAAPANASGLGDALGQGGRALSAGTSLFLMTAQCSGPGSHVVGRPNPFESRPAHEVQVFVAHRPSVHG